MYREKVFYVEGGDLSAVTAELRKGWQIKEIRPVNLYGSTDPHTAAYIVLQGASSYVDMSLLREYEKGK